MNLRGLELLRVLGERNAFTSVPLAGDRTSLYVPFERLTGDHCEAQLTDAIGNSQRVTLSGPIGSGKSSLVEYVVADHAAGLAPLWISAAYESDETVRSPVEFARHMIREVVRWAGAVQLLSPSEAEAARLQSAPSLPRARHQSTETVGFRLAASWIEPSWARDIQETLEDPELERSGADFISSLDALIDLIHAQSLVPVVIIDDSDRWLGSSTEEREQLLTAFFGDTCRMLAQRNWGIVVQVHPAYRSSRGFAAGAAEGFLGMQLDVPVLPGSAAVKELFEERIRRRASAECDKRALERGVIDSGDSDHSAEDVFEAGFEDVLFEHYERSDHSIRAVLAVAEQALSETVAGGQTPIRNDTLRQGISALAVPSP